MGKILLDEGNVKDGRLCRKEMIREMKPITEPLDIVSKQISSEMCALNHNTHLLALCFDLHNFCNVYNIGIFLRTIGVIF